MIAQHSVAVARGGPDARIVGGSHFDEQSRFRLADSSTALETGAAMFVAIRPLRAHLVHSDGSGFALKPKLKVPLGHDGHEGRHLSCHLGQRTGCQCCVVPTPQEALFPLGTPPLWKHMLIPLWRLYARMVQRGWKFFTEV